MVELLVAMAVTLLMVGFFLGFTQNSLNHWNRATGLMTTENQAGLVLDYLDQDLSTAVMKSDGRVWLAATIQPDQTGTGDTQGISQSPNGSGDTLDFTSWQAADNARIKPKGLSPPTGPNLKQAGSSLVLQAYVPPTSATQSPLISSINPSRIEPNFDTPVNLPDISFFRFGQAGVWLRLFSPEPTSNDGLPTNAPVLRAIGYQIVRMKNSKDRNATSYRYYLARSTVRPSGETISARTHSTFAAGFDFFQEFASTTLSSVPLHTGTASLYNNPSTGGRVQNDAGTIRQPNINQIITENVIDFGVLIWGRTLDPNNGRQFDVLLFPSSKTPSSQPNMGFAASTEDGFTRRDVHGEILRGVQPAPSSGDARTGWGTSYQNSTAAMSYGFAYRSTGNPGVPDRPCQPAYVDVFLRILDEEGARLIDTFENTPATGSGIVVSGRDDRTTYSQLWWRIAEQHSHIYTRRIQLPGISP